MGSNSGLPIFVHLLIGLFLPLPIPGDVLPSFAWIVGLVTQVQSRRLNAVAYSLPRGVHTYAPVYTFCPVQGLAR